MEERCLDPAEIARALEAPPDDPLRRHLDACPRCRAVAHGLRVFDEARPPVPPAEFNEADAALATRLAVALDLPGAAATLPGAGRGSRPPGAWRRRPLLALAAVLVACAGLFAARDLTLQRAARLPAGPGAVRGAATDRGGPVWARDGGTSRVTWQLPAGATGAVVVLYDARMRELARVPATEATSWTAPSSVATLAPAYVQVLFLADGDTLSRSRLVAPR